MKITLGIFLAINALLFFKTIKLYKQNKTLKLIAVEQSNRIELNTDAVQESFLKFVSDSREWAYAYIEEVQEALIQFKTKVDPSITYFNSYGDTLSVNRPDYEAMKKISQAYQELILVLPEDNNDKT